MQIPSIRTRRDMETATELRAKIGESSFARGFRLRTLAEDDCLIKPHWVRN